jgi:hypothetical protein
VQHLPPKRECADRLVDIVWGEAAPPSALTTLPTHVWHPRRRLDRRDVIAARSPGARIHSWLAWLAERRGDPADGWQLSLRGLELYRAVGNRSREAEALGDIG